MFQLSASAATAVALEPARAYVDSHAAERRATN
jgi:hypothetical protein